MDKPTRPKLSIVFLNYNRLPETRFTLSQLQKLIGQRQDMEVIAIDNASSDGTGEFLDSQRHWITVVQCPSNDGIAGYNEGFKLARGDYLLVLDDDSHPVDVNTLERLITWFDNDPHIGAIACQIQDTDGQVVHTWHLPHSAVSCPSMAFVGCGFAIRRELFAEIGWYPGHFFLYQNEIEVAIQVLRRGYHIYYDPACCVIHRQSPSGRTHWRRVYYPTRNTMWLLRRYYTFPSLIYLLASRLCFGLIRAIQSGEFRWYWRAVKEGFSYPIEKQPLSPEMHQQLTRFWQHNSLWHHLIGKI